MTAPAFTVHRCGPAWCVRDSAGMIVPNTLCDSRHRAEDLADLHNGKLVPGGRDWLIRLERNLRTATASVA